MGLPIEVAPGGMTGIDGLFTYIAFALSKNTVESISTGDVGRGAAGAAVGAEDAGPLSPGQGACEVLLFAFAFARPTEPRGLVCKNPRRIAAKAE